MIVTPGEEQSPAWVYPTVHTVLMAIPLVLAALWLLQKLSLGAAVALYVAANALILAGSWGWVLLRRDR